MKKLLAIILSAAVMVTVFCSCSKNNGDGNALSQKITYDVHYKELGDSVIRAYEKLCNAVINGENEVKFNTQIFDDVNQVFFTSFPLNILVENIKLSKDNSGVVLTYKNDTEKHNQIINDFYSRVDEILNACSSDSVSKDRFIFNLYSYMCESFEVDYSVLSLYDTIMTGKGAPSYLNSAFEYFILSAGGEASHVINSIGQGAIASYVKYDLNYYFFDLGKEMEDNDGKALVYFAMDSERVSNYVAGPFKFTDGVKVEDVENDKYSYLADSESYTVDGDIVSVVCSDETVSLKIN